MKCDEILNGNVLSVENTDVAMGFCDRHHCDCVDLKQRANDDLILNGNKLDFLNVLNYFLEMSAFGHNDDDGTMGKM